MDAFPLWQGRPAPRIKSATRLVRPEIERLGEALIIVGRACRDLVWLGVSTSSTSGWPDDQWFPGWVILDLPIDSVLPFIGDGTAREAGPSRTILESGSWSWGSLAASFGRFETPMEVIGPPELRDAFATLADRYKTTATA